MLSPHEISDMQSTLDGSLDDLCEILHPNRVHKPDGTYTDEWVTIGHNVPARLSMAVADRGYDALVGGIPKSFGEWLVTLPSEQDVSPEDKIIFGDRTFLARVVGARTWELARRVYCGEVR